MSTGHGGGQTRVAVLAATRTFLPMEFDMRSKLLLLCATGVVGALLMPVTTTLEDGRLKLRASDACAQACSPQPLCDECSPQPFYSCSDMAGFIIVEHYRCTGGSCS